MATSRSNIFSLRAGDIGSISAWLPSRRSTAHQRGAWVVTLSGQVRSGRSIGANGTYLWIGIPDGCWGCTRIVLRSPWWSPTDGDGRRQRNMAAAREPACRFLQALAAAAKEKQAAVAGGAHSVATL